MYCHKCGKQGNEGSKFCDSCGTMLGDLTEHEKVYCHNCGTKLHDGSVKKEEEKKSSSIMGLKVIGVMGLILIVIFALPGFLHINSMVKFLAPSNSTSTMTSATSTVATSTTTIPQVSNPTLGVSYTDDIEYSNNTSLTGDIATKGSITISHGVTLMTNGYSIIAGGSFNNLGTVDAGMPGDNAQTGAAGQGYAGSLGGSGASGGGGGGSAANGSSVGTYAITNSIIARWYEFGISDYLTGGGGGGGCLHGSYAASGGSTLVRGGVYSGRSQGCTGNGGTGGSGSYGIFIQANKVVAGKINADGQSGGAGSPDWGGGGGGGAILIAYGSGGYNPGVYDVSGGTDRGDGGSGGAGKVLAFEFGSAPPVTQP